MGDDVCAPNMRRFEYSASFTESDFKKTIKNYFTSNLIHFKWNGFCNGRFIASADCKGEGDDYQVIIELSENWKELIDAYHVIYFDHDIEDGYRFGIQESKSYTLKRAEKVYEEYFDFKGRK